MGGLELPLRWISKKAFDTLNWDFSFTAMLKMQFPVKFVEWIKSCVTTSRLSVKVNGALEGFFKARTGLRQGDPLSPYLFVLAMEVLTACVDRAISSNQFSYH